MTTAFELRNVFLTYRIWRRFRASRKRIVLSDLSFSVQKGEKIGITGRNGAGKSSLLLLLAGTLRPDGGAIINHCEHTALLTMNFAVEPMLPGRMNAVLHALYLGYTKQEVNAKLQEIINFSGLGNVIDDPYFTYSSGMRARLAFSVVYHLKADLLLIDEILGVGDSEFRQRSQKAIAEKMCDSTAVVVSHDLKTLESLCDRIYRLEESSLRELQ